MLSIYTFHGIIITYVLEGFILYDINYILSQINDFLFGHIIVGLLIFCGIYFSFRTKFAQLRFFPESFRLLGEKTSGNKTSAFSALMISTASKVGTGNIAGIAQALVVGGPGAMLWMWVMSIFSSASAIAENTLAQMYKTVNDDGVSFRGGPSYYIQKALGKRNVGILFSILLIISFAYGFNALQSHTISSSLDYYIKDYNSTIWPLVVGIILAAATAFIIFGGIHRISFISSVIVPVMAGMYLILGMYIIIVNIEKMPYVISSILKEAFNFRAIFSGFAGSALSIGIKRGLLSNEAGMGSSPNVIAAADTSHPAKQGILQILSVFIDTILICSTTAFIVLLSNPNLDGHLSGIPLIQQCLNSQIGPWGIHFITFSIFAFAFSSVVGNYCYAESNLLFIKDNPYILKVFRISCILPVILGAIANAKIVWNIADISMGLMSIVNIVAIILLSKKFLICLKDYSDQYRLGKDPIFNAPKCKIYDTEVWK